MYNVLMYVVCLSTCVHVYECVHVHCTHTYLTGTLYIVVSVPGPVSKHSR